MNTGIASLMFIAILAVSFAHLLWSLGNTWPIRNERLLAQTVIGTAGVEQMPSRWKLFGIAVLVFATGLVALALADQESGGVWLNLLGLVSAGIYLARGIAGYLPSWAARHPQPSFHINDTRVYSPLCIALGVGFLVLIGLRLL